MEGGREAGGPRRAGNLTLLAAGMLLLFSAVSLLSGGASPVGYGWATLAAAAALAGLGLGVRRHARPAAWGAMGLLAALVAFWGLRLLDRIDLGLGIWTAIGLIVLKELWPCARLGPPEGG